MPKRKHKVALVTGGAGFIGSHIGDALIKRRFKVYVVDDLSTGRKSNVNPNAHFTKLSIASPSLPKLIKRIKPDVVFHLAAQIDVRKAVKDPAADAQVNIMGMLRLAHACAETGCKKFIFSSTGGAIYPPAKKPPYSEAVEAGPISPYGISKRTGEMYLGFLQDIYGMPSVALRYANVYGPRQRHDGEAGGISIFGCKMLKNQPVKIFGDGKQTRDYVYVGDVVRANMLAMKKGVTGIINIGTGKQTSVNQLFRKIKRLTKSTTKEQHAEAPAGEVPKSALVWRKARRVLSWEPKVDLDSGLKKTIAWLKKEYVS